MGIRQISEGSEMNNHKQCHLVKWNGYKVTHYHAWIPEEFAEIGEIVKIKQDDGSWDDGWVVFQTFTMLPTTTVIERSQDYKKTRKASDI